jgi:hypothetical protein
MKRNEKEDGVDGQLTAKVEEMNPAMRHHGLLEAGYYSKKGRPRFGTAPVGDSGTAPG